MVEEDGAASGIADDVADSSATVDAKPTRAVFRYRADFSMANFERVKEKLKGSTYDEIDVLLDSFGGDLHASYRLVALFRNHCTRLRAIVPNVAASAATFFVLGADKILLGPTAWLSPIDPQIEDPRHDRHVVSALDGYQQLEELRQRSMQSLVYTLGLLEQHVDLPRADLLSHSRDFVTAVMAPLYAQVQPLDMADYARLLSVGEEYGRRIMTRYAYSHLQPSDIDDTLDRLVYRYPTHAFIIDYDEAKSLRLHVEQLSEDQTDRFEQLLGDSDEGRDRLRPGECRDGRPQTAGEQRL